MATISCLQVFSLAVEASQFSEQQSLSRKVNRISRQRRPFGRALIRHLKTQRRGMDRRVWSIRQLIGGLHPLNSLST